MQSKDIPINPMYVVYSDGSILSHYTNRYLSAADNGQGYYNVKLFITKEGDRKIYRTAYVHRLVAEAFLPNPNNLPQVNHIDGNKSNNDITNLEWCTAKANTAHALSVGLAIRKQPKLSHTQLVEACYLVIHSNYTTAQLAEHFNVCKNIRQWIKPVAEELGLAEQVQAMLLASKRSTNTLAQRARSTPVFGTAANGTITAIFPTIASAAKFYDCNPGNISNSLSRNTRCKGFKWQYVK